ncbi:hypothetical protein TPA0910_66090 [Streptomyces hygroscopicus subsp. sporocinereus]|uniref:Uncharacterized protein n=1 Tax=Streptomyces hygroscopicus TaxID=1912 RepID=A0ABQ3U9T9_STRHY|nr:hypothetical protein TPA0910_66090 [Streptomyces hygroscopicus]
MGERGEAADDALDVAAAAVETSRGVLGQAVVERGRVAVSPARRSQADGDGDVDRGEGTGNVQKPARLMPNSASQYDS